MELRSKQPIFHLGKDLQNVICVVVVVVVVGGGGGIISVVGVVEAIVNVDEIFLIM